VQRHDADLTSLIAGLVFALIGAAYLVDAAGVLDLKVRWVLPLVLIGLGVAGLAGSLLRASRRGAAERTRWEDLDEELLDDERDEHDAGTAAS
jgi:hypothetical protein